MDHRKYQNRMSGIDELSPLQKEQTQDLLSGVTGLPSITSDNVQAVPEPVIDDDIILVTDGNNIYPPCAKLPGIRHETLNLSAGE